MATEYTNETALKLARELAPLWGLEERHLPTTVFADTLNSLAELEAVLAALPQQQAPSPLTQFVPGRLS